MNRSNYKVKVADRKQAKQFKQALLALGEMICCNYWEDVNEYDNQEYLVYSPGDKDDAYTGWMCYIGDKKAKEITFKELLTLLVTQVEQPKSGLLDGKVAIKVSNEREFKLLMEHYEQKGWKSYGNTSASDFPYNRVCDVVTYGNKFFYNNKYNFSESYYKIISFTDFAAEVSIKVPVFHIKSADGIDLYEGDLYHGVYLDSKHKWVYDSEYNAFKGCNPTIYKREPNEYKAFSTKQAAEKWIADQNKPKEIIVRHNDSETSTITKDKVVITSFDKGHAYSSLHLHGKAINEIYAALNALQN